MPVVAYRDGPGQQFGTGRSSEHAVRRIHHGHAMGGRTNMGEYGRYNGFTEQGLDIVLGFTVQKRDPWNSGNTFYYNVTGLSRTSKPATGWPRTSTIVPTPAAPDKFGPQAELSVEFGNQGSWGVKLDYDAITYTGNIIDSIYTVNGATGTLNNGFPAWGGATNDPLQVGAITKYNMRRCLPP